MARRDKYELYVKPYLKQIKEWCGSGATEKEICTALGIGVSTFNEYKNKHKELLEALRAGRQRVVIEIKAALYKKAIGFHYEEKKGVRRNGEVVNIEVYQRYCPPDPVSAAMLLRNYDKDWRDKDAITSDVKKQEMELRKALAKANNFDLELKDEIL